MKTTHLKIEGMTCLNCMTHVQKALEAVPTVSDVTIMDNDAKICHEQALDETLILAVRAAGDYQATVI